MEKHKKKICFLFLCICMVFFSSCGKEESQKAEQKGTPRDHTPSVLTPQAPGTTVIQEGNVTLDVSNISEGYFMVLYTGTGGRTGRNEKPASPVYRRRLSGISADTGRRQLPDQYFGEYHGYQLCCHFISDH